MKTENKKFYQTESILAAANFTDIQSTDPKSDVPNQIKVLCDTVPPNSIFSRLHHKMMNVAGEVHILCSLESGLRRRYKHFERNIVNTILDGTMIYVTYYNN